MREKIALALTDPFTEVQKTVFKITFQLYPKLFALGNIFIFFIRYISALDLLKP